MSTNAVNDPVAALSSSTATVHRYTGRLVCSRNHVLSRDMSDRKRAFEANGDSASGVAKKLRRSVSVYRCISL